ncbi:nlaXM, partial [Symbiodinium sp. KB8]
MAPIQRPFPVTVELRNVTLVTPPVSSGDRMVQPVTDYWRSAFKASDNDFSGKRQKLAPDGDGEASSAAAATVPPPAVPTDSHDEGAHDQKSDDATPTPTQQNPIDELMEQELIAELETQIISEEGNGNGSRNGSDADDNGDDTARDDNAAGLLSFDEMAQEIWNKWHSLLRSWAALRSQLLPSKSNLEMIMAWLNELGYGVAVEKLRSDDFGLPQRRSRLYFFGLRRDSGVLAEPADDILSKVGERLLLLRKNAANPECFLHSEDDNMLDEELERLETRARSASASDKGDGMEPASAKGSEMLAMQGIGVNEMHCIELSQPQMANLAGNA